MFKVTHVIFNDAFPRMVTANMTDIARVEVIHTFEQVPAGPYLGGMKGGSKTVKELPYLRALDMCVAVSNAVKSYAEDVAHLDNVIMIQNHKAVFLNKDTGKFPYRRYNFKKQTVYMINPAPIKGLSIFQDMARENHRRKLQNDRGANKPVYEFVAVRSWGTKDTYAQALLGSGVT